MRTLTENEIRQRKKYMTTEICHATTRYQEKTRDTNRDGDYLGSWIYSRYGGALCWVTGLSVLVTISALHGVYMNSLHENNMWFSNIQYNNNNDTADHNKSSPIYVDIGYNNPDAVGVNEVCSIIGILSCAVISITHAVYMKQIHENHLWFTQIKEVEREISFRTESGLFYSYYKQMINAPTITSGLSSLIYDNITEHGEVINILGRFNVYQEVFLATVYRTVTPLQMLEPVFFYIYTVFFLHACLVAALFSMTWMISESWVAGLLTACFYIANKADTTRVEFVIPLRESFALPFLWIQLACLTYYLRHSTSYKQMKLICLIWICTFVFSICWQFNQFVLLLQTVALFTMQILQIIPYQKIQLLYSCILSSLFLVCLLQFGNTMILCSFVFSFIPAAFVVVHLQKRSHIYAGVMSRFIYLICCLVLVLIIAVSINIAIKLCVSQEADEHIYKFLLTKFGLGYHRDFDVSLYLCNGAFEFLEGGTFLRLSANLVFPLYLIIHIVILVNMVIRQYTQTKDSCAGTSVVPHSRPELCYHAVLCVLFAILACTTQRMKYLWTPYICVLGGCVVADRRSWAWIMDKLQCGYKLMIDGCRVSITVIILSALLIKCLPVIQTELSDLKEFYDPDTVELMQWIKSDTPSDASFTGSMQLLAGVKLCTQRPITNHPHYENKQLRERTKQLYQMYGRVSAEHVHSIMIHYDVSYMILEDSICKSPVDYTCRLPNIVDIDNGIMPDDGRQLPGLVRSTIPRFCDEVRFGRAAYSKYFKIVFTNRTFRIYKVVRQQ